MSITALLNECDLDTFKDGTVLATASKEYIDLFLAKQFLVSLWLKNKGLKRLEVYPQSSSTPYIFDNEYNLEEELRKKKMSNTNQLGIWNDNPSGNILRYLTEMEASDTPMGLIDSNSVQYWINDAAVKLFDLPHKSLGVKRNTTSDWYEADLERKNQAIAQAHINTPFELRYRTYKESGEWLLMAVSYTLIDAELGLLTASTVGSEVIATPQAAIIPGV